MKRMYIAWALLLCVVLSACGKKSDGGAGIDFWNPEGTTEAAKVETTAATQAPTETTAEPTTETTMQPNTIVTMPDSTIPSVTDPLGTIPPVTEPLPAEYGTIVNYSIPIANPYKDVYYSPNGQFMRAYGSVGYDTIVEEFKDSQGVLWGRLATGGWTTVYGQILPAVTLYAGGTKGNWGAEINISGNGSFSGDNWRAQSSGTYEACVYTGKFKVTSIENNIIYLERTTLSRDRAVGKTWTSGGVKYKAISGYCVEDSTKFVLYTPSTPTYLVDHDVTQWFSSGATLGMYVLYCPSSGNSFFGSLDFLY